MLKDTKTTPKAIRLLIARTVDSIVREYFPTKYPALCHAYAVIGSNVISIALGREYRPVAGLAVIDCGGGCFMNFTEAQVFDREGDGAYHCWIESCPQDGYEKEIVDISFIHNSAFAKSQNIVWRKKPSTYLWGNFADLVIDADPDNLPPSFPEGKMWVREMPEGMEWLNRRVAEHMEHYAAFTALALKKLQNDSVRLSKSIRRGR